MKDNTKVELIHIHAAYIKARDAWRQKNLVRETVVADILDIVCHLGEPPTEDLESVEELLSYLGNEDMPSLYRLYGLINHQLQRASAIATRAYEIEFCLDTLKALRNLAEEDVELSALMSHHLGRPTPDCQSLDAFFYMVSQYVKLEQDPS